MILLDTCALLWWTLDPAKLSPKAAHLSQEFPSNGIFISSISIWEIGKKVKKGNLFLPISIDEYTSRLKKLGYLEILPVDENIWIENLKLDWTHRDSVDRTIVATAKLNDLPILTKDRVILDYYPKGVW